MLEIPLHTASNSFMTIKTVSWSKSVLHMQNSIFAISHSDYLPRRSIVFVHGLNGDRERTWTDPGTGLFWPQSLLPTSNINARILTFGYDANPASFRDVVSQNCVGNHAMNLLTALATYREDSNTVIS